MKGSQIIFNGLFSCKTLSASVPALGYPAAQALPDLWC
jgi:hypothetical protein